MPAKKRRPHASLIRRLIERPQRFQFFQAVRLLDLWLRRGDQVLDRVLRFKNSVSLSFPASQIEALSVEAGTDVDTDAALQAALADGQGLRIHITPAFMGFLGVNGVLPYYYTDAIAAQIHFDQNEGGRAFFDSFSHRGMTLFYRAWEKCRVEYRFDSGGKDGFLPVQLALAGIAPSAPPAAAPIDADSVIAAEAAAHYAALLRHRPVSGDMLVGVLSEYFGLPFRLEQFVGGWERLRPEERTTLGGPNNDMGFNTMLGSRYWRRDLGVRLWIGPLSRVDYDHFFPKAGGGKALKVMLALFAVPNLRVEVRPILRACDIVPLVLGRGPALGRGAALINGPVTDDDDTARYHIQF